jgi:cell division protease FtsH
VTQVAKQMVMRFGMSEKLGPRVLGRSPDMPFLGRELGNEPDYSEEVAREIDEEIRRVIGEAHQVARSVLRDHFDELKRLAEILIERETIDRDQFERLIGGESAEHVFHDETKNHPSGGETPKKRRRSAPKPKPYPVPGALSQPPPPEGAKG